MNDAFDQMQALHRQLRAVAFAWTGSPVDADELVRAVIEKATQQWASLNRESLLVRMVGLLSEEFRENPKSVWHLYRYHEISEADLIAIVGPDAGPEHKLKLREILKIIAGLGKPCREVLVLSALGYGIREVAELLDIPLGAAGRRMMECRQRFLLLVPSMEKDG